MSTVWFLLPLVFRSYTQLPLGVVHKVNYVRLVESVLDDDIEHLKVNLTEVTLVNSN